MIEMIQENKNAILQNTVGFLKLSVQLSSAVSCVWLFVISWIAARQASLSITNSQNSPKLMCIDLVMPSSHLILCRPLLLLPPVPQGLFQWVNSLHEVAKVLEFQIVKKTPGKKKKNSVYLIKHIILLSKCQAPHLFRVKYILVKTEICSQVQSNLTLTGVDKWDHKLGWGWMGRSKSNFCKVIAC